MGQKKAFYRQRIPESNCARNQTVEIDILVTLGMVTEKSYNLIMSRPPSR